MTILRISDLPLDRTLDRAAMADLRGAGSRSSGSWVAGWIVPFSGMSVAASSGGNSFISITNNIFNQFISANQATFQTQNTDVYNTGAGAVIDLAANQARALASH